MEIKITLTDAQYKALSYVALDAAEWVNIAANSRANAAIEEIVNIEVQAKLAAGEPITGSKEQIVLASTLPSAAQRQAAIDAELASISSSLNTEASE
jgi:phage-related protein